MDVPRTITEATVFCSVKNFSMSFETIYDRISLLYPALYNTYTIDEFYNLE